MRPGSAAPFGKGPECVDSGACLRRGALGMTNTTTTLYRIAVPGVGVSQLRVW